MGFDGTYRTSMKEHNLSGDGVNGPYNQAAEGADA
jgi:hypothetical protein